MQKPSFSFIRLILLSLLLLPACAQETPSTTLLLPSQTPVPVTSTSMPQPTEISIPTPALGIGSTMVSDSDGATHSYVPEGKFQMGSTSFNDSRPQHLVNLDAFWIDQTEVTNQQYARCVLDKTCTRPLNLKSPTRSSYYGDPEFDNYPVIYIEWAMAKTYCEWAGRRLPTEAEWEKAARGVDGYIYPWGNEEPNDGLLNYDSAVRDTTEVGKYLDGKSVYGAVDMAGNVWEWVNDWYDSNYYQRSPVSNPLGPDVDEAQTSNAKSLRGGSWYFEEGSLRSIFRYGVIPADALVRSDLRSWLIPVYEDTSIYGKPPLGLGTVGFRCAMNATP